MGRQLEHVKHANRVVTSAGRAGVLRAIRRQQHRWRRHTVRQDLHGGNDDVGGGLPRYKGWYA